MGGVRTLSCTAGLPATQCTSRQHPLMLRSGLLIISLGWRIQWTNILYHHNWALNCRMIVVQIYNTSCSIYTNEWYILIYMTVFFVDRANACQNFDNYWWKIQKLIKNGSNIIFFGLLGFKANSGFGFCDMILEFGANSGFWSFDTILGAGLGFFDTILGFRVLFFSHHNRVRGLGFFTPN